MFLIAGIQPRVKKLEDTARRCPARGRYSAYHRRVDHYLSLFFIPLLKVKTGEPVVVCDSCSHAGPPSGAAQSAAAAPRQTSCSACGRPLKRDFSFCPYCGTAR